MIALLTPQNMVDEVHGCFSLARWRKLEKLSLSMRERKLEINNGVNEEFLIQVLIIHAKKNIH